MPSAKRVLTVVAVAGLTVAVIVARPSGVSAQADTPRERIPAANPTGGPGQEDFTVGIRLLEKGKAPQAIERLESAIAKDSQNPQYHIGLVHAYAADRQSPKAWSSLRKALELDDRNPALGAALVAAWQSFGIEGLFNVGRSVEDVAKALGRADRVERHADHERWIYGFMALNFTSDGKLDSIMDLRGLDRELLKEKDRLNIQTDGRQWLPGHRLVNNIHTTTEYVLPGQEVQNWEELVTVERLLGLADRKVDPQQLMESIKQRIQNLDPKAEWKIIEENENDVLYEWRLSGTLERPPHHELARLVKGRRDIYRIAYAARTELGTNRDTWTNLLRSAKLVELTDAQARVPADTLETSDHSPDTFSFLLGANLGLSLALYNANPEAGATTKMVDRTRLLALKIGKTLPRYPELSGSRAANQNDLLRFGIKTVGSPYAQALRDQYEAKHVLLFEMGLKSNLLLLVYQPGQSAVKSIATSISAAAQENDIPEEIWGDLVKAIDAGLPFAKIKTLVMSLNSEMQNYLASR